MVTYFFRYGQGLVDNEQDLKILQRTMKAPLLEMVGFKELAEKQKDFAKLRVVVVTEMSVSSFEDDIGRSLGCCQSLDISDNLFSDWEQIAEIAARLEHLKVLNVSGNKLDIPKCEEELRKKLANIRQLVAARLGYDWDQLAKAAGKLNNLVHLQAFTNSILEIRSLPEGHFANLEMLDLNDNPLSDWNQVMSFSKLPKLFYLNVSYCKIMDIDFPEDEVLFPALKIIQLSGNLIDNWQSIANLHRLKIEDFRMRSNPILETENGATCRQIIIASMKSLKVCNGTEVERIERIGSELDYLKKYGQEYLAISKMEESDKRSAAEGIFFKRHPRYKDFLAQFGPPEEEEISKPEDNTIKGNLLGLRIECPDVEEFEPVTKRVPPTMTVRKLRPLLQRIVKVKGHSLILTYKCMAHPDRVFPFDDELKELTFYILKENDIIYVRW